MMMMNGIGDIEGERGLMEKVKRNISGDDLDLLIVFEI